MWFIHSLTFFIDHALLCGLMLLIFGGIAWFFRREHQRLPYKQQRELEQMFQRFEHEKHEIQSADDSPSGQNP